MDQGTLDIKLLKLDEETNSYVEKKDGLQFKPVKFKPTSLTVQLEFNNPIEIS